MKIESKAFEARDIQKEYDAIYLSEPIKDEDRAYRWFARSVVGAMHPGARVLDVACGGGYFLRELDQARAGGQGQVRTVGIDLSGQALALARKNYPAGRYAMAVGEGLPFRAASFDWITCLGSLEHFLDPQAGLREMHRLLKPQGKVLILVPNMFWYKDILQVLRGGQRIQRNQSHEMFAVESEWRELIASAGLQVERALKYNGIARRPAKQFLKDIIIPKGLSYHFIFVCRR